jgi:hypothetical protein
MMTEAQLGKELGRSIRSIEARLWRLRRDEKPNIPISVKDVPNK